MSPVMNKAAQARFFFKISTLFLFLGGLVFTAPLASAATPSFSFTQTNYEIKNSCIGTVQIMIDPGGNVTNAAEILLNYDSTKIEIQDSIPTQVGTQIKHGQAFALYAGNVVTPSTGTVRLTGFGSDLGQKAVFAEISVKALTGSGSTPINFVFFGASPMNTTDSNIANAATSNDVLSAVQNTTITFATGSCVQDTSSPNVSFQTPQHLSQGVAPNSAVTFTISDAASGVDIDSLVVTINGVQYTETSPGVTITGNSNSYSVTVIPTAPFPEDTASSISVRITDFAGNTRTQTISFNLVEDVTPTCPITEEPQQGVLSPCTQAVIQNLTVKKETAPLSIIYNGTAVSIVDTMSMLILGILEALIALLALLSLGTLIRFLFAQFSRVGKEAILSVTAGNKPINGIEIAIYTPQGEKVLQSFTVGNGELKGRLGKGTYIAKVVQMNHVISSSTSHTLSYSGTAIPLSIVRTATKLWYFIALAMFGLSLVLVIGNLYTYASTAREISLIFILMWSAVGLFSATIAAKQR
jgi:hypothetical protein